MRICTGCSGCAVLVKAVLEERRVEKKEREKETDNGMVGKPLKLDLACLCQEVS